MNRRSSAWLIGLLFFLVACEQLGNPPQFATGPTVWQGGAGSVVTTTRSFQDDKTIRRFASEGMSKLDYADASFGPSQTLTIVSVQPRTLMVTGSPTVTLLTTFKMPKHEPITRKWIAPASSRRWNAAFAIPEPPEGAITYVAP